MRRGAISQVLPPLPHGIQTQDHQHLGSEALPLAAFIVGQDSLARQPSPNRQLQTTPVIQSPVSTRDSPTFDLASRIIAYTTNIAYIPSSVSAKRRSAPETMTSVGPLAPASDQTIGSSVNPSEVATKVAKELASGVKVIGEYGYQAISSYFASGVDQSAMHGATANANGVMPSGLHEHRKERKRDPLDGTTLRVSLRISNHITTR
eukprot:jgi/Hompol1/6864/HPOL_003700-RA